MDLNNIYYRYAQNGFSDETISLFNAMKEAAVNPNNITLVSVLSACASIGALDVGKSIDDYASRRGIKYDIYVATALIDMYAKSGNLDVAYKIFESMPRKNEVSWNAMISALAFHGRAQEALSLFNRMSLESSDARPDDVSFVGVLSACVHAGLVDEGKHLFDIMNSSFGLIPKVEHYSCMVDLLSRAGRVYEAWDFIEMMPQKPDEILLGAFLGACQKLKNIDVGERVMQLLLEMEPSNSGNYIISSKIYANLRRWDDSARLRQLMRQRGVTKIPGCSWIEMDSQLVEFRAGDLSHLLADGIQEALDLLYEEMAIEVEAAVKQAMTIYTTGAPGDILIFLIDQDEIEAACYALSERMEQLISSIKQPVPKLLIFPVYSQLPADLRARIFQKGSQMHCCY
ncbi:Pentatricopeptide repeat-containing protein [Capsicum chinense]|nr:Pentatricopeptide repeat-containing protein [Capsicum chinense]